MSRNREGFSQVQISSKTTTGCISLPCLLLCLPHARLQSFMVTERLPHLQPSQSHSSRKRKKWSVKATFVPFMKQTKAFEKPLQDIFYVSNARIASPAFANCKNGRESVYLTWLWKAVTTGRNESMEDEHQIDSSAVTGTNDFTQVQTLGAPSNTQTESNL